MSNKLNQSQTKSSASAAPSGQSSILQRKCACGTHNIAGDKCDECKNKQGILQRKSSDNSERSEVPPIVHEVLNSSGQPLDKTTRAFFERRFAHNFSGVPVSSTSQQLSHSSLTVGKPKDVYEQEADRIADSIMLKERHENKTSSTNEQQREKFDLSRVRVHTDARAAKSARAVNALAYTVGHNIVFGAGKFAPGTHEGRRLLAHELTHVVQQSQNLGRGLIQRAEVDDRSCVGLTDIESDIDTKVNSEIAAARTAAPSPLVVADFLRDVADRLGGKFMGSIEQFIKGMSNTKRTSPAQDLSGTKFAGVENVNRFYLLHTLGSVGVVGPAANVKGICMGADKLGHFFEEGFLYFQVAKRIGTTAAAESTGRFLEISDKQGLGVTGVFSNADLAANLAGKKFYEDLEADPNKFIFKIGNYITTKWNETANPSFYSSAEGSVIWSNLLTGTWKGNFTSAGGTSSPIAAKVDLTATASGTVTGTVEWTSSLAKLDKQGKPPKPNKEKIKNGKITQRTTSVSGTFPVSPPKTLTETPVKGVTIDFEWEAVSSSGKGKWESVDEQNLVGTWGIGSSADNGGTWQLKKV